ncbi:MAG TPA: ARMT1-like domain-containing protein [bacterium]|nr:ARMT1-like domain-containing protein [bacterium]
MKARLECFPCYFRQALQASEIAGASDEEKWEAARAVAALLTKVSPDDESMLVAEEIHKAIKEALGNPDPYYNVKEEYTGIAEGLLPRIEEMARAGADPLLSAAKLAIAGNIIDFGAGTNFNVEAAVRGALEAPFAIDHLERLREALASARSVLYLGDNTGEIYFDRPMLRLIKFGGSEITFVTRGAPILNDATIEYARRARIDEFASLADTGAMSPGFPPGRVRPEVFSLFETADVVVSKGQANFETLCHIKRPGLFFLLKIKCEIVARMIGGGKLGDVLLMEAGRFPLLEV